MNLTRENVLLRLALVACVEEIERLHLLHGREFEGKVGEPDLEPVAKARKLLATWGAGRVAA